MRRFCISVSYASFERSGTSLAESTEEGGNTDDWNGRHGKGCALERHLEGKHMGPHQVKSGSVSNRRWHMTRESKLETTLGDLVVALTEETGRHVHNEKMTYEVVAYIVSNFLNRSNRQSIQPH